MQNGYFHCTPTLEKKSTEKWIPTDLMLKREDGKVKDCAKSRGIGFP